MTMDETTLKTNGRVAMALARANLHIFPCWNSITDKKIDKTPLCQWRDESTDDPQTIFDWWMKWPSALVGIDLSKSGLIVADGDRHSEGQDGVSELERLVGPLLDLNTPITETAGNGVHIYFVQPDGMTLGNREGDLPYGINIRGYGGYVIAAGCVRPGGKRYAAMQGSPDLATSLHEGTIPYLPKAILDLIRAPRQKDHEPASTPTYNSPSDGKREQAWAWAALEGECNRLGAVLQGGRNEALNRSAFYLGGIVARGWIDEALVRGHLEDACRINGDWKDDPKKCKDTINRGVMKGKSSPHQDLPQNGYGTDLEAIEIGRVVLENFLNPPPEPEDEEEEPESTPAPALGDYEIPEDLTHPAGIMGDIVEYILATSPRRNRVFAVGAAITIVATVIGRRVAGPTSSSTHLYISMLGRSSAGKDRPLKAVAQILSEIDEDLVGPSEFMSQSALSDHVTTHPLSAIIIDELGAYFEKMTRRNASAHEAGQTKLWREYWGAFTVVGATKWRSQSSAKIEWPSPNLLGVSTHDDLFKTLGSKASTNGFLNRFLLLSTNQKNKKEKLMADQFAVPQNILNTLMDLFNNCRGDVVIGTDRNQPNQALFDKNEHIPIHWADADVEAAYDKFSDLLDDIQEDEAFAELYGRTAEMAIRLATVHAVSRGGLQALLTMDDFLWGKKLAMWSATTMVRESRLRMADTDHQSRVNEVKRIIYNASGTITERNLKRKMNGSMNPTEFKQVIETLETSGMIITKKVTGPNGGRPSTVYELSNYAKKALG